MNAALPRALPTGWPWLIALLLAALVPLLIGKNNYVYDVMINVMIFSVAAYGMNLMLGYAGLLPLAHAGFFGIGAYAVGILTLKLGWSFWLAWPVGVALCAVLGLLLGLVAFRTQGDVFAIFTLGVGVIITQVINKWDALTGGNDGLNGLSAPRLLGLDFGKSLNFYFLALITLALTIVVVARLRASLFGRSLIAIRGGEDLARSAGINVYTHKLRAMMLSTALAGLAGGLYAVYVGFLGSAITGPVTTFTILLYLLVGGVGTLAGPLLGTLIIRLVQQGHPGAGGLPVHRLRAAAGAAGAVLPGGPDRPVGTVAGPPQRCPVWTQSQGRGGRCWPLTTWASVSVVTRQCRA